MLSYPYIYNGNIFPSLNPAKNYQFISRWTESTKSSAVGPNHRAVINASNEVKSPLLWEFWIYNFSLRSLERVLGWKHCKYKEWVSFFLGSWGMNRSAEQTNRPRTASRFTRFVCPALRFIPPWTQKKDTHSLSILYLKSVSTRKPCKICKFVRKQGCPIFMTFGVLEGLCTSILNTLNFFVRNSIWPPYGAPPGFTAFGPEIPCKIPENWPSWHYYISVNTKPKYLMKWYTGRVEIVLSNVKGINVWY